jgi:hypothetical protein
MEQSSTVTTTGLEPEAAKTQAAQAAEMALQEAVKAQAAHDIEECKRQLEAVHAGEHSWGKQKSS